MLVGARICGLLAVCAAVSTTPHTAGSARPATVMVLDFAGDGFALTTADAGVRFDLDGDGGAEQVGWTAAGSDDQLLAVDWNRNNVIDDGRELVGSSLVTPLGPALSGTMALSTLLQGVTVDDVGRPKADVPVPPGVGAIEPGDDIYRRLLVWNDANHNGRSEPGELRTLAEAAVTKVLAAGYRRMGRDGTPDRFGNVERFRGGFFIRSGTVETMRPIAEFELAR